MFEYHFFGLDDGNGVFTHTATTHDFLQVLADITKLFGHAICGLFVHELMEAQLDKLEYLRVADWKFELELSGDQKIVINYSPRIG